MPKYLAASLGLAVVALGAAPRAEAAGIPVVWGTNHNFDKLATINMPAELAGELPAGAELARHSETFAIFWVIGLWVTDKGYAIHVPGADEYYDVDADQLKSLQGINAVPDPLPSDGIAITTYLMGFIGWAIGLVVVLLGVAASSRKSPPASPGAAAPGA